MHTMDADTMCVIDSSRYSYDDWEYQGIDLDVTCKAWLNSGSS